METNKHNTTALLLGTAELKLSVGAGTRAAKRAMGRRDLGNIVAYTPEVTNEIQQHEGSYRGVKSVDRKWSSKQQIEYIFTADEWTETNLGLIMMATANGGRGQAAQTLADADSFDFATTAGAKGNLFEVTVGGERIIRCKAIALCTVAAFTDVTADATANKLTAAGHGYANGDVVLLGGTTAPAPLELGSSYYVVNKTTDDFQVALTSGGTAIDLTAAGTAVKVRKSLKPGVDYDVDLFDGEFQLLTAQSALVYPVVTADAISDGDDDYFLKFIPLDKTLLEGYADLYVYDQEDRNKEVMRHENMKVQISAEKATAVDGKKNSEFQLRLTVQKTDPGDLFLRQINSSDNAA